MKRRFLSIAIAAGTLFAATQQGWAIPPRQHLASGIITSIDDRAHTLRLAQSKDAPPLVFLWNTSTRFIQWGSQICSGALEPGQPVSISYRREVGQLVPREVKLRSNTPTRCASGECCTKRSDP